MIATLSSKKKNRLPTVLEHASGDKRFKILEAHIKKHQFKQDALIEVLHKAQELFGYLEDDLLLFVSYKLKLPPSRVYGVATFYHFFTLKPKGKLLTAAVALSMAATPSRLAMSLAFSRPYTSSSSQIWACVSPYLPSVSIFLAISILSSGSSSSVSSSESFSSGL